MIHNKNYVTDSFCFTTADAENKSSWVINMYAMHFTEMKPQKCVFVCVKQSWTMRWRSDGKLSHPEPTWEWVCSYSAFPGCWVGIPWFIHYLKSCSNSVWDVKHDSVPVPEWELTLVYFNEVCVCLTSSSLFFQIQPSASCESERKRKRDFFDLAQLTVVLWVFECEGGRFFLKWQWQKDLQSSEHD